MKSYFNENPGFMRWTWWHPRGQTGQAPRSGKDLLNEYNADYVCCVEISIMIDVGHLHWGSHVAVTELPGGVPVLHLDVLAEAAADF